MDKNRSRLQSENRHLASVNSLSGTFDAAYYAAAGKTVDSSSTAAQRMTRDIRRADKESTSNISLETVRKILA